MCGQPGQFVLLLYCQVEDVEFPALANPLVDNRGLTQWVDMMEHEGSVITKNGTVLEKDQWAAKKIEGGCFRLAVVPSAPGEATVYLQFVPVPLDFLVDEASKTGVDVLTSNIVAIRLGKPAPIQMAPREAPTMKASMGILPMIYINGNPPNITLPPTSELRVEMAGTLRGVSVPIPTKAKEFDRKRTEKDWPPAEEPAILWPEAPRVQRDIDASESQYYFIPRLNIWCFPCLDSRIMCVRFYAPCPGSE